MRYLLDISALAARNGVVQKRDNFWWLWWLWPIPARNSLAPSSFFKTKLTISREARQETLGSPIRIAGKGLVRSLHFLREIRADGSLLVVVVMMMMI